MPFPAGSAKEEMGIWKANKGREGEYLGVKIESITSLGEKIESMMSLLGGAGGRVHTEDAGAATLISQNIWSVGICLWGSPTAMRAWERGVHTQSLMLFPMLHSPSPLKQAGSISPAEKACGSSPGSLLFPRQQSKCFGVWFSPQTSLSSHGAVAMPWRGVWAAGRAAKGGPGGRKGEWPFGF